MWKSFSPYMWKSVAVYMGNFACLSETFVIFAVKFFPNRVTAPTCARSLNFFIFGMKQEKEVRISYWAAHLTTVVSVSLVLLIIGVIALGSLAADSESRRLKEKIELSVILTDSVGNDRGEEIRAMLAGQPYAREVRLITKEEALKKWEEDTGENLETTFGVNPLSPEVAFNVTADYASPERIASVSRALAALPGVDSVSAPDAEMVDSMNRNLGRLTLILGAIGAVMLIISFVLINNTIHLTIYSRRFSIHTMQLVGATDGFIRRPFVGNNTLSGLIAGLIASGILLLLVWLSPKAGLGVLQSVVGWGNVGIVCCGITLLGMLICALAASLATTKYLRKDYDALFS